MKRLISWPVPIAVLCLFLIEAGLRHLVAGSNLVSAILSAASSAPKGQLVLAGGFLLLRLFTLWIVPPLILTWLLARLWAPSKLHDEGTEQPKA